MAHRESQTTMTDRPVDEKIGLAPITFDATQGMNAVPGLTPGKTGVDAAGRAVDAKDSVGLAVLAQRRAIPMTGKRLVATKWEYWTYILYYFNASAPMVFTGGALRQLMINLAFPKGYINWGGSVEPVNSVLLDISGIQLAINLVLMLMIGPYADYGNWRPWILIVSQILSYGMELGMCAVQNPDQWAVANGLYIVGSLALSVNNAFYYATFPTMVRDLPKMIKSEEDVAAGIKSPEEHSEMDAFERSKIFNLCSLWNGIAALIFFGLGIAISHAVGYGDEAALIRSYRILLGFYTPVNMLCTIPFFFCMQWRPGQQRPKDTSIWLAGPKQAWYALKCIGQLRQVLLYLCAYICLFEAIGAYLGVYFILQNEVIHYSPELSSAFGLVQDACAGIGSAGIIYLHRRFKWSVKWILFFSAINSLFPVLWGAIGTWTNVIGYHNVWEFWFFQVWNMFTAAASNYNVTMISEVAPASKLFMFYALFNIMSKSTGFAGPFITAAIIKRTNNTDSAFWFMTAIGGVSLVLLFLIDTDKAKIDAAKFVEKEASERYTEEQRAAGQFETSEDSDGKELDDEKR